MAKKIEFQVGFNVRKEELNDIYSLLKGIQQQAEKGSSMGNLTPQLQQAAVEAKKLENILNKAWNSKLNQMDLSKVTTSINTTYGSIDRMRQKLESLGQGRVFNKLQSDLLATNMQLKQSNKFLDNMAQTMANTVRFGLSSSVVNRVSNEIQRAYDYSIKLNTSLTDIRIVSNKSADDMERFAIQANKAAKALGSSTLDYTKASTIYYQQGLSDEDVAARAETTLKAANVTGQTGEEVSEQLTAIWNGYKVSAEEAELYIDKVAKVAAGTAADLEELATGMSKVASAANLMGIDIDQLNAMMSTMISVTRESPETIGTAMRNILARMGQLQSDGEDEFGVTLTKVTQQMSDMGIQILDENNNIRNMGTILDEVAEKWNSWSKAQQMAAAKVMAGTQNYSRFITLMDNQNMWQKALEMSRNATGELDRENQIYLESTEAHLQQLATTAEETYATLFDTDVINDFTDALTGALTIFNNFLKTTGGGLSSLTNLGLMLGNVFSKQLGAGIGQMLNNRDLGNLNEQNAQAALSLARQNVSQAGSQNEIDVYEREVAYSERLLGLSKSLSTERFNELNTLKHSLAQDELRMAAIYDYEEATKDSNQTLASITTKLNAQKQATQVIQKEATKLVPSFKQLESYIQEGYDTEINVNDALNLQVEILDAAERLMKQQLLDKEQSLVVQKMLRDFENGDLSEEETLKLQGMINEALERQLNIEKQIKHEKDMQEAIDSGEKAELEQRINQNQNKLDKGLSGDERTALIQDTIRGGTAILSLLQQIGGTVVTIFDDSLSGGEKLSRIGSTLLFTLSTIAFNFKDIKAFLPAVIQLLTGMTAAEYGAAKAAGTLGTALLSSLWPILAILAMIAASITGIVWIVNTSIDSYNKSAQAAEEAGHQAEMLAQAYQDCVEAVDNLNQAISDYETGIKGLDKLTKGTDEYEEALKKANKQAQDLIAKYDLLAGKDYFIDPDGVIRIKTDEGSSLSNKRNELEREMSMADSKQLAAQIRANQANIESKQLDYQRKTGIDYSSNIERQYDKIIGGMGLIPGAGPLMAIGGNIARFSSEERGYNLDKTEINELTKVLSEAEEGYASILGDNEEDVRNWILNNENLSDSIKDNVDEIVKEKDALISLISSTEEFEKSLKQASEELVINHIENNKVLDEQLNKLAKDKETGEVNEGQKELIEKALAASESASAMKSSEESNLKLAKIDADKVESNADLENFVKDQGLDAEALGLTDLNDEKSAKAYLKYVLGYSDDDIAHMKIEDNLGKTSVKWTSNYTDSKGTAHDTDSYIYKDLNDEEARSSIAYQVKADKIIKQADENAQIFMQDNLDAINNMMQSTQRATSQFGADFSNIILNSMAGRQDGKNANLDFTNAFKNLTDGEIDALMKMDSNKLAETLGLTDEDFWNLGYEGAAAFEKAFDEGLLQHEKQALSTLMSQITQFGSNFSETELSEDKVSSLSKSIFEKMNASDMTTLSSSPLSLSQIDFNAETVEAATEKLAFMAEQIRNATEEGVALTNEQKEQAKELNYSEDALKAYAEELQDTNDSLKDNDEATVDMALANVRMNKGIDTLANNFEHWNEVLKDGNKNSGEYYEVLSELKQATEDMFGVKVSNEFLQNADNLAKLGEIAKGNVESFDELQEAATRDYVMHLAIIAPDQATVDDIRNSILGMVNDVQSQSNIEIGTTLDPSYVDQLNEMLRKGQITEEQMNKILGGIGYSPTVRYKTVPGPETKTHHRVTANVFGNEMTVAEFTDYSQSDVQVPEIEGGTGDNSGTGPTYIGKPSSSGINYSNNKGRQKENAKKNSGSGEKEKDPDKMDAIENEKDRYHDVNIELKQIETELGRIQKQKDKLLGQNLIDNLNKQLSLLNKQMDKTNEKISIAKDEAGELRGKLSSQGVSFKNDGTIANYTQAYEAQLSYVNALVAKYNSMSAKEQEGFKETVEQAKKDFETFTKNMEKYDELVSDTIPGLEDEIQEAIDEQIEIQIEKFNMEIEIRLDLKEAELEWNEFKKKIIDGIKDDDILGNAGARLQDYNAYYKDDGTGIIQRNTEHIDSIRNELLEMDRTGWSEVYGDNRAQALEDLQTYYQQMMEDLQEIEEIQEDIHDSYLDMIDEAQEGFDKQLETYEQISSLIEHDMKLIELVYGEENYEAQANYYQKQDENYRKQLEFQRVQKDFWWEQMQAMEEGSEEWEAARENWMSAVDDWKSSLNDAIENITDKYLNAINLIFQKLNDEVTSGKGLDYVSEQWELINQNADQYLDTINSMYGIQKLENKYLDAIDQTDSISAQRKLNDLMKEEVAALEKKDKLTQYDIDRANMKYEIALKQIALEEAQQNKSTMRLRRDSQGNYSYQFVSDEDSIAQTREELQALYNELYNFDLSAYRENLDQLLSVWTEYQEKMAEAAQINDPVKRAEKEALIQEQYGQLINSIVAENEVVRTNLHESAFTELADLYNVDVENFQNMTDAEKEILMSDMIPQWTSGVQQMADVFADEDEGFVGVCKKAMEDLADTTEEYMSDLEDLEDIAGVTYDEITEGTDDTIDKTETLLEDNQELIDKYGEQLEAIRKIIIELNSLISKYNSAKQAAMEATEAAYKYWQEQKRQEAEAAAKEQAKSTSNNNNNNSNSSSSSSGRSGTGSGGDGVPRVGDICTYIGGTYYYDSYGTSPSGNRGPGKQVTITQVKTDGRPYPIHVQSSNSAYGWLKKEQLSGYDTGGYTGNWGDNSGRLALLHQKELVLNADDTPNLLKAVSIMRNITDSIGSNILAQMAGVKAPTGQVAASTDTIEQIVQIDANFPNVQSSDEIKTAINDLVSRAAQRVHRKR